MTDQPTISTKKWTGDTQKCDLVFWDFGILDLAIFDLGIWDLRFLDL